MAEPMSTVRIDGALHTRVETEGPICFTDDEDGTILFIKPGGMLIADVYIHGVVSLATDECRGNA